jgi:hypothetical protein
MKPFTCIGLALVLATLAWLAISQQRMNRDLRFLLNENRRLTETLNQQLAASAIPSTPQPSQANRNHLVPGKPATQNLDGNSGPPSYRPSQIAPNGFRSGLTVNTGADQLASHSPDGKLLSRPWGPEQVVGPANTMQAGDQSTAWAQYTSSGPDGEWLQVTFERAVDIAEVIVRETYNPGAISKVVAILPNGQESILWEGTEPSVQAPVDMSFPATQKVEAKTAKIYLDRRRVSGWNEIDAVELVGRDGSRQWAASATVSSAYSIAPGTTVRNRLEEGLETETIRGAVIENDVIRR